MTAWQLSEKYLRKKTDPVAELESALLLAEKYNSVFISIDYERSLVEAHASKARWDIGRPLSYFDGVLISWKDLFNVAGSETTAGSRVLSKKNNILKKDADIVAQLTRMGMVNLGKTNMTEFAYSGLGLNPHFGTPKNIVNENHIPGGSSSGSAIAVASGITPLSMGTDTAGSIRIPAAFNGILGFRASQKRYSMQGVHPLARSVDTIGPLGKSVRDFYILDQLIHGNIFPKIVDSLDINDVRFVYDPAIFKDKKISLDILQAFEATLNELANHGFIIEKRPIRSYREILARVDAGQWIGSSEAYVLYKDLLDSPDYSQIDPLVSQRLLSAKDNLASMQVELYQLAQKLKIQIEKELSGAYLLCPTVSITSPAFREVQENNEKYFHFNFLTLRLTMPGSFLDMPGITIPNGVAKNGMPSGILVSTSSGRDEFLLQVGMLLQKKLTLE